MESAKSPPPQTQPKATKSVTVSLGRKTVSRIRNQAIARGHKARLTTLVRSGKLDEARAYALAHGLGEIPGPKLGEDIPYGKLGCLPRGEGVASGKAAENTNHSIPTSENPQWESKDARGATLRSGVSETNQGGVGMKKFLSRIM